MSGILRLESLTKGNTLKQGDKTPLKYRLFDADGEKLNIAGKSAKVRLVYPDFLTIGYEKDGLTVAQDDTVTFTIDSVIPPRMYHVEIIVDDKFVFPSRADEAKFTVDKSSLGTEANIIEIVGVDAVVRKAVDLINDDPSLIIDEDKLVTDIISNTGIGNINEYYKAFNDLKPKAEQAITKSAEALTKSQNALNVANGIDAKATNALSLSESADTLSKSVQEQFNQVIIDGDSSVEAAQARVDASGQTNPTLKARLDKEHNEVIAQLAHKATKGEITNSDFDTSSDSKKIKLLNLADEVQQALTGNAPALATITDGAVTMGKYADRSIKPNKLEGVSPLNNLFNRATVLPGKNINSSGELFDDTSKTTSDLIPVSPNSVYTASKMYMIGFYTIGGVFISRTLENDQVYTFTTPANCHYIRVSLNNNWVPTYTLNRGSTLVNDASYGNVIDWLTVRGENLQNSVVTGEHLTAKSVNVDNLKNAVIGKNLFDKDSVIHGYYVSRNSYVQDANYDLSYWIKVKPNTSYSHSHYSQYAFYDKNKAYVGIGVSATPATFITPANCEWMRVSLKKSDLNVFQLEEGTTSTSYEEYYFTLNNLKVDGSQPTSTLKTPESIFYDFLNKSGAKKLKLLGDSITHGMGGTGFKSNSTSEGGVLIPTTTVYTSPTSVSWANLLRDNIQKLDSNITVLNYGISGTDSNYVNNNKASLVESDDDLVIIMLGTNDTMASKGRTPLHISNYLRSIVDYCKSLNIPTILMASTPFVENDTANYSLSMHKVNYAVKMAANSRGVTHISLYDKMLEYEDLKGISYSTLMADGLHPNDEGYTLMHKWIASELGISHPIF